VTLGSIGGAPGPWSSGAGGTLDVRGTTIVTGGARSLTVNSGTVTLATLNADTTARTVTKVGAGTLAITGAAGANLQGSFSLGGGTLILGHNSAMGTGAFLYNAGTLQASQDLVIANAFDYANNAAGGSIGGSNNITFSNTFRVAPGNAGNAGRTLDNSLASGKTLTFSGNVYLADLATVARTLTLAGSGNTTFSGNIANFATSGANGALTVTSTGVTTLSGSNSYSGVTIVNAGTLVAAHANACGTVGTITANSSSTFAVASGITFTRAVTFNSGSAIGGSGTFSCGAAWSLPTSFTVRPGLADAPGTLTVDTAAGNLTFGNNTLEIDFNSSAAADRLTVSGGGTLDLSGTTDTLVLRGTAKPGTYVLADAAGVSGTFATENTTGLIGKGTVVYEANRVLFVVPATGTVVSIQ
jgi:fibronectin-binding autotransporter adhesin